jgi:hypothetical protein
MVKLFEETFAAQVRNGRLPSSQMYSSLYLVIALRKTAVGVFRDAP